MTVELERPFVWPEPPEDYSAWNQNEVEESEKEGEKRRDQMMPSADTIINEERRKGMREHARELLEGKRKWKPATSTILGSMITR